ncbi:MAG: alkaline phosphatase family protein [Sandaracinaceae bacterium]|nr:alkaline phosphatase family protein [Sandaracinaceae bacterium]
MSARHLILGFDGFDLELVRALGPEVLPHVHQVMRRGVFAAQRSVQPPATLPNWTTFLTGVDPGRHGVFDFTTRHGYDVRFSGGSVREAPSVVGRLDALGLRCACLFFPATYPPERLAHGVFVSGWDAPVAFEADASFVWPPALHGPLLERFAAGRFDDVDEFDADRPGWHAELPSALVERVGRKRDLGAWLLGRETWDAFALYFGESDTAAHYLYGLHDPRSPRHPSDHPEAARAPSGLTEVYVALDRALGELLVAAAGQGGPEAVELTIVSDHGSGGSSDTVIYLNRVLEEAGLLRFREAGLERELVGRLKEAALTRLPPALRERLFGLFGTVLPSALESRARFGAIDFAHTTCFSDELNYMPAVHLNIRGREPQGTVAESDLPRVRAQVVRALQALRDPLTGAPVVAAVHRREDLFEGPYVERAPDLLLELHPDRGYTYNLMPSGGAPPGTGAFRRLAPDEWLGRKGRSLPGSHRPNGFFAAAGPRISAMGELDMHIADATATWLARMDVAVPPEFAGRVLYEALGEVVGTTESGAHVRALPDLPASRALRDDSAADEARVEARLRALGYVD